MTKGESGNKSVGQVGKRADSAREQRLKEALRVNLRRRKAQKRGRAQQGENGKQSRDGEQ